MIKVAYNFHYETYWFSILVMNEVGQSDDEDGTDWNPERLSSATVRQWHFLLFPKNEQFHLQQILHLLQMCHQWEPDLRSQECSADRRSRPHCWGGREHVWEAVSKNMLLFTASQTSTIQIYLFRSKYGRGNPNNRRRKWVFGGICRETRQTFMVMCPGNKRTKKCLHKLIRKYIAPGYFFFNLISLYSARLRKYCYLGWMASLSQYCAVWLHSKYHYTH